MASWSGLIHSACFFLIGTKLWYHGKRFGYSTQIQFFTDRFQSPTLGLILFPILVGLGRALRGDQCARLGAIDPDASPRGPFPHLSCRPRARRHSRLARLGDGVRHRAGLCFRRRDAKPAFANAVHARS